MAVRSGPLIFTTLFIVIVVVIIVWTKTSFSEPTQGNESIPKEQYLQVKNPDGTKSLVSVDSNMLANNIDEAFDNPFAGKNQTLIQGLGFSGNILDFYVSKSTEECRRLFAHSKAALFASYKKEVCYLHGTPKGVFKSPETTSIFGQDVKMDAYDLIKGTYIGDVLMKIPINTTVTDAKQICNTMNKCNGLQFQDDLISLLHVSETQKDDLVDTEFYLYDEPNLSVLL